MKAICCVDANWGIGKNNQLLYHLKSDLQHFKNLTLGQTIVMGSRTFLSLPNAKALPGRKNLVLSHHAELDHRTDIEVFHDIKSLFASYPSDSKNLWLIGGANLYQQLLPFCDEIYLTKVDDNSKHPDCFFPNLDQSPDWQLVEQSQPQTENDLSFTFCVYRRS